MYASQPLSLTYAFAPNSKDVAVIRNVLVAVLSAITAPFRTVRASLLADRLERLSVESRRNAMLNGSQRHSGLATLPLPCETVNVVDVTPPAGTVEMHNVEWVSEFWDDAPAATWQYGEPKATPVIETTLETAPPAPEAPAEETVAIAANSPATWNVTISGERSKGFGLVYTGDEAGARAEYARRLATVKGRTVMLDREGIVLIWQDVRTADGRLVG